MTTQIRPLRAGGEARGTGDAVHQVSAVAIGETRRARLCYAGRLSSHGALTQFRHLATKFAPKMRLYFQIIHQIVALRDLRFN